VVIIETSIFSRQVQALFSDDEYRQLQMTLVLHPDKGSVIPGSGGLRKNALGFSWSRKTRWCSHNLLLGCCAGQNPDAFYVCKERTG
jgi:hypothetical protein